MQTRIRNIIGPFFHVFAVTHHIGAMGYSHNVNQQFDDDLSVSDQRILDMKNFALLFFTSWNMTLQLIYFILAVITDILNITSKCPQFREKLMLWKGYIFTSMIFPCSIFVSAVFWSVYSINRELVLPEVLDEYIPKWLNHSVHTNIVVFLIIEVLIVNQLLPSFKSAFLGLTVLTGIYDFIFFCTYFTCGRWIYGLWTVLSWPERIILTLFNYFFVVIIMRIGIMIQNFKSSLSKQARKKTRQDDMKQS